MALTHVNSPRRVAAGKACEILDVSAKRMHELAARKVVAGAPDARLAEVDSWQHGSHA